MPDEEKRLLEMAAKAYWADEIDDVCSIRWLEDDQCIGYTHGDNQDHNGADQEFRWNPLEEDADALRLAVKLEMRLELDNHWRRASAQQIPNGQWFTVGHDGDPCAATRRAIVRAAADIGEKMP